MPGVAALATLAPAAHAVAVPTRIIHLNPHTGIDVWQHRNAVGRALRGQSPRDAHALWQAPANRPDPIALIEASNMGRQADLVPMRFGRMAGSPFAFLRGSACVMAWDLARTASAGLHVFMCGDAHLNNFGLFGTPQGDVVIDLNDFDEVTVGPWEWDLKRLATSIALAGREAGLDRRERRRALLRCARGYRMAMIQMQSMPILDLWYMHTAPEQMKAPGSLASTENAALLHNAVRLARRDTNRRLLSKVAERDVKGQWRFREDPPLTQRVDATMLDQLTHALQGYAATLARERHYMFNRYRVVDAVHRVVGVGSVGTRSYVVMMLGNDDQDVLFLQVKEAVLPAAAPFVPPLPEEYGHHQGRRVVLGQRLLQAAGDPLLGWTQIDGRDFYVRQFRNLKASIPIEKLDTENLRFLGDAYGALLARAHARTGDAAAIAGYLGRVAVFDKALAEWAEAYADQTERDHAVLLAAIKSKRVSTMPG